MMLISKKIFPNPPNQNETMVVIRYYGPDPGNHPDSKELSNIFRNLKSGPEAAFVLGCDGVLQASTIDHDILDAIGLPPRLIKAFLDRDTFDPQMEDMYRGVDGTKVPQEQCWKPGPSLLPPPFAEEEKACFKKEIEENKEVIQENIRKRESGEVKPCGVVVCSPGERGE